MISGRNVSAYLLIKKVWNLPIKSFLGNSPRNLGNWFVTSSEHLETNLDIVEK